jgi:dipeptidyl aminopeptidase/acylaminoacyl peptidase
MYRASLLILLIPLFAIAQEKRAITIDDYFSLATITEFRISPDGKQVAYVEARWDGGPDESRKNELWVVSTAGQSSPRKLTFDRANPRQVRWSFDSQEIYFVANMKRVAEPKPPYDGTSQIWRIAATGGTAREVTRIDGGIAGFDYAPKSDELFITTEETARDKDTFGALRAKFTKPEYGHGVRKVSALHKLSAKSWRLEKLIPAEQYIREFSVTQDGEKVGLITAADDTVISSEGKSLVQVWQSTTGKLMPTDTAWKKDAASPYPWLEDLAWNPSGTALAFCTVFDAYPSEVIVIQLDGGGSKSTRVIRREGVQVRGYGSPLKWLDDRAVAYLGEKQGFVDIYGYGLNSRDTTGVPRPGTVVYNFEVTSTGGAISLEGTASKFPELLVRGPSPITLTNLNPQTANWKLPTITHITWKAPDGSEVGGVLELPADHKKGEKLPLVVAIHGGPTTSTKGNVEFDPHNGRLYFSTKGYAVLLPNYRGSTGLGDKFTTDLVGNENDLDVKDILAGIQHLVKEGIADRDRVACMGWSNGGYLTNCLITLKDSPIKFKAASSGAGILDTVAEWGFNDEPAYPVVFKKGTPWETPEIYKKTSPTYGLGNVTTPTLVHVGGNDVRCPPGQSQMLYRALKEYRKVPTELVVYPGEPHGLTKAVNRRAKMEWDLAWFEQYLTPAK